jgi:hypothetical protein
MKRFTLKTLFTATTVIGVAAALLSGAYPILIALFLLSVPAIDLIEGAFVPRKECGGDTL